MKLLTDDAEFAAFCEREFDVKPSEQTVKIVKAACNLSMIMADIATGMPWRA